MINVQCNECPIRNFCKQLEVTRESNELVNGGVAYHDCPIYQLSENSYNKPYIEEEPLPPAGCDHYGSLD